MKFFAVSIVVFYGLSLLMLLLLVFPLQLPDELFKTLQGLGTTGTTPGVVSLLFLVPLYFWYRRTSGSKTLRGFQTESRRQAVFLPLLLFALAMSVRVSFAVNLGSPLEKMPLIFLLLSTIMLAENYSPSSFGFTSQAFLMHLALGFFLFVVRLPLPYFAVLGVLITVFGVDPFRGFELFPFLAVLPFQVFAVAISEEGLFRGYMQTKLSCVVRPWVAIFVQAFLFGLWHVVWHISPLRLDSMVLNVSLSFLFGVLNGAYFRHTGSLTPLVLSHGLWNSFLSGVVMDFSVTPSLGLLFPLVLFVVMLPVVVLMSVLAEKVCGVFGVAHVRVSETRRL